MGYTYKECKFEDLHKVSLGTGVYIQFRNGKTIDLKVVRQENGIVVCKSDVSVAQEIYLNGNEDIIEHIIIEDNTTQYSTGLNRQLKELKEERKRLVKVYI